MIIGSWEPGEESVTISRANYDRLLHDSRVLAALQAGGVGDWEWYSDSLDDAGLCDDEDEE